MRKRKLQFIRIHTQLDLTSFFDIHAPDERKNFRAFQLQTVALKFGFLCNVLFGFSKKKNEYRSTGLQLLKPGRMSKLYFMVRILTSFIECLAFSETK